jgi:hypothetical protein
LTVTQYPWQHARHCKCVQFEDFHSPCKLVTDWHTQVSAYLYVIFL